MRRNNTEEAFDTTPAIDMRIIGQDIGEEIKDIENPTAEELLAHATEFVIGEFGLYSLGTAIYIKRRPRPIKNRDGSETIKVFWEVQNEEGNTWPTDECPNEPGGEVPFHLAQCLPSSNMRSDYSARINSAASTDCPTLCSPKAILRILSAELWSADHISDSDRNELFH